MIDDVDLLGVLGPDIGPDDVDRLAARVVEDGLRDELVSAVLETCDGVWEGGVPLASDQIGDWRLDLGRTDVRSGLVNAMLAGALVQQELTEMVVGVVAALVPSVLDVERTRLTVADGRVVAQVRLHPDVVTGALDADALHEQLPPALRVVVNPLEFADLVARLREVDPR